MVSEEQRRANTENPTTHGLTAKKFWVKPEDRPRFRRMYHDMIQKYKPKDSEDWVKLIILVKSQWALYKAANYPTRVEAQYGEGTDESTKRINNYFIHANRIQRLITGLTSQLLIARENRKTQEAEEAQQEAEAAMDKNHWNRALYEGAQFMFTILIDRMEQERELFARLMRPLHFKRLEDPSVLVDQAYYEAEAQETRRWEEISDKLPRIPTLEDFERDIHSSRIHDWGFGVDLDDVTKDIFGNPIEEDDEDDDEE